MHAIHFNADQTLLSFIEKKLNKLETFYDRIVDAEVFLRLEKGAAKENKVVEIKLNIPGNQLFASEQAPSFEAAADLVAEALRRQLKRIKEKRQSHLS